MAVERLFPAEGFVPVADIAPGLVVGHPVERIGQRPEVVRGSGMTKPSRPWVISSPAPLQAGS